MHAKFSGEKKKQFYYAAAAIGVVSATMLLLNSAFEKEKPVQQAEVPKINIIDKKDTDASVFRKDFAESDANQNAKLAALEKRLAEMQNGGNPQAIPTSQQLPGSNNQNSNFSNLLVPPPTPPSHEPIRSVDIQPQNNEKPEAPKSVVMGDMIGNISSPVPAMENKEKDIPKQKKIEIPSGSFMSGVLLSGIDAPTGGKAQTSPHPVLIKVVNMTKLPNKFRANLKECHILGSGFGDLSSERAYIRVEKIACMTVDGRAVEKGAKGSSIGYVTGEDGKTGLNGRVVSKQGAILARTLAAGFLEGVSKSFQNSSMTYSIQPTGSIATPDPADTLQMGLMGGAGEASKKLADFYMKLANEMFPIVEVSAGRKVDVVLLDKISFEYDEGRE